MMMGAVDQCGYATIFCFNKASANAFCSKVMPIACCRLDKYPHTTDIKIEPSLVKIKPAIRIKIFCIVLPIITWKSVAML